MASQDHIRNPLEWGFDQVRFGALALGSLVHSLRGSQAPDAALPKVKTIKAAEMVYDNISKHCVILDVSHGGASIRLPSHMQDCPDTFILKLHSGRMHHCRLIWREKDKAGVEFFGD